MKHFVKSVIITSSLLFGYLGPVTSAHASPLKSTEIKVQINDKLANFPDAQPFLDNSHLLQVPIRTMSDLLGYEAHPEPVGQAWKVTLKNQNTTVSFTTGSLTAIVNEKPVAIASAPQLVNGKVYVPFRSLADSLKIRIQWDPTNRIAILNEDKNYHAPAWYATQFEKIINANATAYTGSSSENGGHASVDYFGNPLQIGTISVDPSVIPLGSKVYIEGYSYDGLPAEGMYATAADIGGSVKGNKIDIYVPDSKTKAMKFGVQQVKIYMIKNE
ncbi:stalk domain-containing protein [Paenibacillus radicis (ex Xue et al. 2023)]|uniref:Stalk domain-containing protein n=1 Tax=Paenibacillus radicis (ex Xue et al. 2023) TaxID=2972489 RepID=A0ABT1YVH5_9BACL|nr:stalk domain-containing protein [Paenibacillus radicis (ex Xue et al. 2023)]MCR8636964.1 stalk domain-containing protein [Paenibacillus radicis (ex Xue et al. 2023)]